MRLKPGVILFDMDGVLIDSLDLWWHSLNSALKAFNHEEISREDFASNYWGYELSENLRRAGLSPEIGDLCNAIYFKHIDEIRLYPDTLETLQKLDGYKKAIVTNTPKDCARQIYQKLNLEKYFDAIITRDQVARGKPSPEIVFEACERLGVSPMDALLVGDTPSDVKAGKAAGCTVVGINTEADFKIGEISELVQILEI
jgi:HAD superfamily hydrolase (TIGR01509 family)